MFLENKASRNHKKGWIEVICGSMFSGKTEELLRRIRKVELANKAIVILDEIDKVKNTPEKYPRRGVKINKNPL